MIPQKIKNLYDIVRYTIPNVLKNFWIFKRELIDFRSWEYRYNISLFKKSLEYTLVTIENGSDTTLNKLKKVKAIKRLIFLLNVIINEEYINLAELDLNQKRIRKPWTYEPIENSKNVQINFNLTEEEQLHNSKIYERAHELEFQVWDEMSRIIRGQKEIVHESSFEEIQKTINETKYCFVRTDSTSRIYLNEMEPDEKFDGTGMRNWWD